MYSSLPFEFAFVCVCEGRRQSFSSHPNVILDTHTASALERADGGHGEPAATKETLKVPAMIASSTRESIRMIPDRLTGKLKER